MRAPWPRLKPRAALSYEHEVHHDGPERRVVLIIDFLNPYLPAADRLAALRPNLPPEQLAEALEHTLEPPPPPPSYEQGKANRTGKAKRAKSRRGKGRSAEL